MSLLPQFGFFELILVAAIALMVVGPKDLPRLMRSAGRMAAQARRMASEFTAAFDQMAREAEMEEMRKEIEALKSANPVNQIRRAAEDLVSPVKAAADEAVKATEAAKQPSGGGKVEDKQSATPPAGGEPAAGEAIDDNLSTAVEHRDARGPDAEAGGERGR
ncbi:MAG: twin-arginine translocase subunit TatB [Alphaproteobacteria bacterium]|nr:twin-arginine translocase subunit TatB [Alphaproteobacteria bacterium]